MSVLATDGNSNPIQAFRMPMAGMSYLVQVTVGGGVGISSVLPAGTYRIIADADVTVAQGATVSASDMPLRANQPEYFYINANTKVSVFAAVAPANVTLTRMP